jgi:hypothetical protein
LEADDALLPFGDVVVVVVVTVGEGVEELYCATVRFP